MIDNDSGYPPLLEWYDRCEHSVHRLGNFGPRAPWSVLDSIIGDAGFYVVSDCDLSIRGVPSNVLEMLALALQEKPQVVKAGLALRIDDLPETAIAHAAREVESGYWDESRRIEIAGSTWYSAAIDTTFAMYRKGQSFAYEPALRLAGEHQCRHLPWYYSSENLPEDERYYLSNFCHGTGLFYTPRLRDQLLKQKTE